MSHDPVLAGEQCVTCHDPHASDQPKMLRASQGTVCLKCHDQEVKASSGRTVAAMGDVLATSPVIHGAVAHGDCSACHSVHGATHERLLKQLNPDTFTDPYDAGNYAMCFGCHDRGIAEERSPTQFRDGDRNLHAAHLRAGERSRGCSACHSVHSSTLPRLLASSVRFEGGSWEMPMKFFLTPTGGSCAPGCHEQMAYSRLPGGARQNGGQP
ncbi:MAG TPA: cytochrome c3 family protein [Phycisphaerales bacterium]|nr:cytochrome c3 family protein [Phycisphaerales bacterium]